MSQSCKKIRVKYSKEVMDKALQVKSRTLINTASKLYKVPKASLHSKFVHKYDREKVGPVFEEDNLVQWILHMCSLSNK